MKFSRLKPLHAALIASVMGPTIAFAQDRGDVELPMFRVTESALGIDPNVPANAASITEEVLDRLNMPTAEDSLRYLPNLNVRQRYIGDRNAALEVRGMSNIQSARGLVLADGVIISNFLDSDHQGSPRWSMVLPEEVERVDVIYGPYSALYSGNALGAVVNFTTRMPDQFEARAKALFHRQEFDLYGTDDTYNGHVINGYVGDRIGRFSYTFGASTAETTGQPNGFVIVGPSNTAATGTETEIVDSSNFPIIDRRGRDRQLLGVSGSGIENNEQNEFKLKLGYDITDTLEGRFTVASWTMDSKTGQIGDTTYLRDADDNLVDSGLVAIDGFVYDLDDVNFSPRDGSEEHWMYAAQLRTRNAEGWNYDFTAALYDMKENRLRTADAPSGIAYTQSNVPGTMTANDGSGWWHIDFKADNRFGRDGAHWLTAGAHYSNYELEQESFTIADWRSDAIVDRTGTNQGTTEIAALFVQDAWQFAEQWKTVLGLRYEHWSTGDGRRTDGGTTTIFDDRSADAISPKVALIYTPDPLWSYRLSLAHSTRFPTVSELYQVRTSVNDVVESDADLAPEKAVSADFTIETLLDNAVMRFTLWGEDSRDTIFRYQEFSDQGGAGRTVYQNIDHVRIRGIEWVYDTWNVFGVTGLDLHFNVAFNESEVVADSGDPRNVGNEFYRIPRIRSAFVATWHQNDQLSYTFGGRYSGRARASLDNTDIVPNAIDGVSSFTVFDVKVNFDLNRHLEFGAGVNNLLDERYFVGHPYSGRTYFADVTVRY